MNEKRHLLPGQKSVIKAWMWCFLLMQVSSCNLPPLPAADVSRVATPPLKPTPSSTFEEIRRGQAEIIFHHGTVLTMEGEPAETQAIAISGGSVLSVGEDTAVLNLRGPGTRVIDLEGRVLMPGFVDAHTHVLHDSVKAGDTLEEAQDLALRYGITSLGEMFTPPDFLDDLRAFHESGELRVRVSPYLIYNTNCGERMGEWYLDPDIAFADSGDDMLRVDGVKIFADGGSCRGVALSFELEEGGGYGDLFITEDELISVMRNAQDSGFQVAVHALGDRALDVVLDAFGAVPDPQTPVRHRIEHNAVIRPEQLPRYSEVDLVATIRGLYPSCSPFGPPLPEPYRAWEWRTNSLIQSNPGLHVAWHSDYPYHSLIPMDHLFGFVTRYDVGKFGQTCPPPDYLASDTLPVEDALKIMTIEGAYALRREEQVGSLQPGKFADVVILSADPRSVPTMEIKKVDVLMTMVGGQVEWCAKGYEHLCPEGSSSD